MAQQGSVQTIGMVGGESMKDGTVAPSPEQKAQEAAKVEQTAIETSEILERRNTSVVITLSDGKEATCKVAKAGQVSIVLRLLKDIAKVMEVESTRPDYLELKAKQISEDPLMQLEVLTRCEQHIWPTMAALCDLNERELKELDLDDAMSVAKVLWELNQDFFLKKVLPLALGTIRVK